MTLAELRTLWVRGGCPGRYATTSVNVPPTSMENRQARSGIFVLGVGRRVPDVAGPDHRRDDYPWMRWVGRAVARKHAPTDKTTTRGTCGRMPTLRVGGLWVT